MQNEFARTFNQMLQASGKSLTQVAYLAGVDRSYVMRLASGEKRCPSPETILKLWIGVVFDPAIIANHPAMVEGLSALLYAAGVTAASSKLSEG